MLPDGRIGKTRSRAGRTYFHYGEKAIIPRSALGTVDRFEPPADVERRELSGPCSYCGVNATTPCKHRRAFFR